MEAHPPAPDPESQRPAPPPPPGTTEEKASGGMRFGAVVLALLLAFGGAVMIAVAVEIGDTATCEAVANREAEPNEEGECFDGSSGQKTASLVLSWPGGIAGVVAALAALAFAIRGRGGSLVMRLTAAAVTLSVLGIVVGSV